MEFPGYDNRGRQQGHVLAYLGRLGKAGCLRATWWRFRTAIKYDYWVEETYGAYT